MMTEIRVKAWYHHPKFGYAQLDRVENNYAALFDKDGKEWCLGIGISTPDLSGPYHIEPGDRVRPKPAGDKCWDNYPSDYETEEGVCRRYPGINPPSGYVVTHHNKGIHISCLILLEKEINATALGKCNGDVVATGNPTVTVTRKLNPRVLPSVSGSELLWPDVRPGTELDKLPMDTMVKSDRLGNSLRMTVFDCEQVLTILLRVNNGISNASNSDRERIRKIIPEIRKKLATLEGRL